MNFYNLGELLFNIINTIIILFISIILSLLTASFLFFPLITAILITLQNTFIYNKGYFYKTFFKTILFVLKNYFKTSLLFYLIFLIINFLFAFAVFYSVPMFFKFSIFILSSLFFILIIMSASICTLKITKTDELLANSILISIKHINFTLSILAITFLLIYIFLNSTILVFVVYFVVYIVLITYIIEYGIIKNYK